MDHEARLRELVARLRGHRILVEGIPGMGKTALVQALAKVLIGGQAEIMVHEERLMERLLNEFKDDKTRLAGWFQVAKLIDRQRTIAEIERNLLERPETIHLIDRSLPGDLSFFLYHAKKGAPPYVLAW